MTAEPKQMVRVALSFEWEMEDGSREAHVELLEMPEVPLVGDRILVEWGELLVKARRWDLTADGVSDAYGANITLECDVRWEFDAEGWGELTRYRQKDAVWRTAFRDTPVLASNGSVSE